MMPFHRNLNAYGWPMIAAMMLTALVNPFTAAIAADPVANTKSKLPSQANVTSQEAMHVATQWNKHRSAKAHEWNRAASRPNPVSAVPATDLYQVPRIRHVSARGSEHGEVSTAAESTTTPTSESVQAELEKSAPTSSLSVREQLLNALKKQRESTIGTPPSAIPGSLTIMNSPVAPAEHPVPAQLSEASIEPADPTPKGPPSAVQGEVTVPAPPVGTVKSRIGLTRTWEADLQSTEPYVRERAQRYLRLEMQLLKLRANQAAAAEHSTQDTDHHVPESATEHVPEPSSVLSTPTDPDHHETPDAHSADHSPVHEPAATDPPKDVQGPSPHPLIMENVVVDGPIDRLGLANNLFATDEYPMALEMYQETAKSELTAPQHFWVEYQTANCLRRLGKPAEASQRYRKLADHPEAGWLSQQARWWVETLEKIRVLEKTLADNAFDHHRAMVEEVERAMPHAEPLPAPPATDSSQHKEATQDDHAH